MEKRWIFISILMHAALLFGVGAASHPASDLEPVIIEVSLVAAPAEGLTRSEGPALTPGESFFASEEPSIRGPLKTEAAQKPESTTGRIAVSVPEPADPPAERIAAAVPEYAPPQGERAQPGIPRVPEPPAEITKRTSVVKFVAKPNDRTIPGHKREGMIPEDIEEAAGLQSDSVHTGEPAPEQQTADSKQQTLLLAFSGNTSSLGGILATGTDAGTRAGPGPGTGYGSGTRTGADDGTGPVEPEIVSMPEPAYPVLSRRLGEEGRVIIKVKISAEGGVRSAEVIESSTYPRLDQAALQAIKRASFEPAMSYGAPMEAERKVAYVFRLEEE